MTETDYRVVLCEVCGSEGRLVDDYYGDRPCKWCEGTGGEVIVVQPIEQDDLMELELGLPPHSIRVSDDE